MAENRLFTNCTASLYFEDKDDSIKFDIPKTDGYTIQVCASQIEIPAVCQISIVDDMLHFHVPQPGLAKITIVDVPAIGQKRNCDSGFPLTLHFEAEVGSKEVISIDAKSAQLTAYLKTVRMPSGTKIELLGAKFLLTSDPSLGKADVTVSDYSKL